MFRKIKQTIENHRSSRNYFWAMAVLLKDTAWKISSLRQDSLKIEPFKSDYFTKKKAVKYFSLYKDMKYGICEYIKNHTKKRVCSEDTKHIEKIAKNIDEFRKKGNTGRIYECNEELFERDAVPTEKIAYELLKENPIPDACYLAVPWTTLINKGGLGSISLGKIDNSFTICQHIKYESIIPILKKIGTTVLFTPHVNKEYDGITVLPFPHYAINAGVPSEKKDIFYSFIGTVKTHPCRKDILNFSKRKDVFIKERDEWHFARQLSVGKMTKEQQEQEREEYIDILSRSRFSLCPAGTGASTIRFWESLKVGAIPVLISDYMRLPEVTGVDWNKCIIRIKEKDISNLENVLRRISPKKERYLRKKSIEAYNFFSGRNFVSCIRDYYGAKERIGGAYGGWTIPRNFLNKNSICYSFGAGEDISFDSNLNKKYLCQIKIFDPTPKAKQYFNKLPRIDRKNLQFYSCGVWTKNGKVRFYYPKNSGHVSASILNVQNTDTFFNGQVKTLSRLMNDNRHKKIDLLKLDIEGAEYSVIDSIIKDKLDIGVILVEFHNEKDNEKPKVDTIKKIIAFGYDIFHREGNNYSFIKKDLKIEEKKIKIYCYATSSYNKLIKNWLLPSIKKMDEYEPILKVESSSIISDFKDKNWGGLMLKKVDFIIEAIKDSWGNIFVFTDPDVQFLGKTKRHLLEAIKDKDIVFQKNNPSGELCAGFFVCRANERNLALWTTVRKLMQFYKDDQEIINLIIQMFGDYIKWGFLPEKFKNGYTGQVWEPGIDIPIPRDIVFHHANYTVGLKNKIAQLTYVKNKVKMINIKNKKE